MTAWAKIEAARAAAHAKHGDNSIEVLHHADTRWLSILVEEVGEVAQAMSYDKGCTASLRAELVDVLAVASAWFDALDRDDDSDASSAVGDVLPVGSRRTSDRPGFDAMWDGTRWVMCCLVCGDEAAYCDGKHSAHPVEAPPGERPPGCSCWPPNPGGAHGHACDLYDAEPAVVLAQAVTR